jgi:hypothetical protein
VICQWITINVSKALTPTDAWEADAGTHNTSEASSHRVQAEDMVTARRAVLASSKKLVPEAANVATEMCPVCFIPLETAESIRITPCEHIFCSACLEAYVEACETYAALNCPLCRGVLHSLLRRDSGSERQNADSGVALGHNGGRETRNASGASDSASSGETHTAVSLRSAPGPPTPSSPTATAIQVVPQLQSDREV